jgi:hypothetical protein
METVAPDRSLVSHFASLEDNRCPLKRRHVLHEMIVIAIAAILSGADGWVGSPSLGAPSGPGCRGF